ncbi:CRISPR-associated endoribonuclease Cas2 [termite gut metagenome]|uniref:CRISPR-associated endoribonuclease Cas2 n=1 Tax=termite gut metagenome TaxID=433724 RepID=A0A5J4R217_9ZZZZ
MTKKKAPISYLKKLQKLKQAGLGESPVINRLPNDWENISDLNQRIQQILGIIQQFNRPVTNMLFFVMYDIESNKVRYHIAKYLIRKGCTRVQRSIFLADLNSTAYEEVKKDLTEVQAMYDNNDSILVVPISTDYLLAMKVIGKSLDVDLIMHNKNTLFF